MKVAIIGYGRMGQEVEKVLKQRQHEVIQKINSSDYDPAQLREADVAIEFTQPEAAFQNLVNCFKAKLPVVTGTTGWLQHYNEAAQLCQNYQSAFLYASNFSLGVNLFFELNKRLAGLMAPYDQYQLGIEEIHHTKKLDKPSGTAVSLAEQIEEENPNKKGWTLDEITGADQIPVTARREHDVPGTHIVSYRSDIDDIEIKHTAHNRQGFALGAVLAAEFVADKEGVFTMKDVLNL